MLDMGRGATLLPAVVAYMVLAVILVVGPPGVAAGTRGGRVDVIVGRTPGRGAVLRAVLEALAGGVTGRLPIVDGFTAAVRPDAVARLRSNPAVRSVSPDHPVQLHADPSGGGGSPHPVHRRVLGADALVAEGVSGRGVTAALIDTGVSDVPDLAGRLVHVEDRTTGRTRGCVDFSGEGRCDDSYGHGTSMAGTIVGDGAASDGRWTGVAPSARVLSLEVAGRDGSSDVSKVRAAIQWAVSYTDRYDIEGHGNDWHGDNWHGDWEGSTSNGEPMAGGHGQPWAGSAWHGLWD